MMMQVSHLVMVRVESEAKELLIAQYINKHLNWSNARLIRT